MDKCPTPEICSEMVETIKSQGDEIERLRGLMRQGAATIKHIAFEIPAPNTYTPRLTQLAVEMESLRFPPKETSPDREAK